MLKAPCQDCPDRYLGCHDSCQKYISFRKQLTAYNEKDQKERDARRYDRYYARKRH